MTKFNFHRRLNERKSFIHKKMSVIKTKITKTLDHFRFSPYNHVKMIPVDLDHGTLSWMKAHVESMLARRTEGYITWMELANAWLGRNELVDLYAGDSIEKKYSFVAALNRLQKEIEASRKTISNWDEALPFIELEMNLPQDKLELKDDFLKKMEEIRLDRDISPRRSKTLWQSVANRKPYPLLIEDDEDALLEEQIAKYESIEAEKEPKGYEIVSVSKEDQERITSVMRGGAQQDIVAQVEGDTVQRRSLSTLMPGQWLNDEVIHAYLQLLTCEKQHFFKSFFVTKLRNENVPGKDGQYQYTNVKRWSKKVKGMFFSGLNGFGCSHSLACLGKDVFALDKVFFPVNQGNAHWTLAVAFVQERRLQFYDSMGGGGRQYLQDLERYFKDEFKDKKKTEDTRKWTLVPCTEDTPRQRNVVDCGVFICIFAEFLSRDRPLTFSQDDIYICRNRIAHSLLTGKIQ